MAARIKAGLHVVHVASHDVTRHPDSDRLSQLRQVVCDVGATWHEIIADDTVEALIEFARRQQITQIMLGSSQRSRWQEMRGGGSIVKRVTRRATGAEVDVHIIARRHEAADANSDEGFITERGGGTPQTHMGR
jgi:two-component system sensor histidine kinase KdpD